MTLNEMTGMIWLSLYEDLYRRLTKYHGEHADYNAHVQILSFAVLQVAEKALVNKCHEKHADCNL